MADLRNRLVIGWRSPRTWRINATTAASYPVVGIADAEPIPFPGFDRIVLSHARLQAVMREHRYVNRPDFRSVLQARMEHDEQEVFAGDA